MSFEEDIRNTLNVLRNGGIILYPTDTIWGLGCDATNEQAVKKIFSIKRRSESKSLILLAISEAMVERYVKVIPPMASEIISVSENPVTIVYPGCKNLAPSVIAEDGTAGIRITHDRFCSELITRFRKPVVSTSANISGEEPPQNYSEIQPEIIKAADYVVLHRRDDRRKYKASPVIRIEINGEIKIIRK
jgi:L-threonylcarbamoyladenylate synthase